MLIVPNYRWVDADDNFLWDCIPYNLCLLGACIKDIAEVKIVDAYKRNLKPGDILKEVIMFNPDVIGITCMMDHFGKALHMTASVIKASHTTTIVVGGVYPTVNPEKCVEDPNINFVCVGEGEGVLHSIINKDEGWKEGVVSGYKVKLDFMPLPDYSLIDYPSYMQKINRPSVDSPPTLPYGRIITSRGCPYNCNFCQVKVISGQKWRPRSVDSIIKEMHYLVDTYKVRSWVIDDDNFLEDRGRAMELFERMIDEQLNFPWKAIATPIFKVDNELLEMMMLSGCEYVDYAIESGVPRVLKDIIHKPLDLDKALQNLVSTQAWGIFCTCNFIIGFPGETWDEIRTTLKIAEVFDADYTKISVATPLRGTELWRLCEETSSFKPGFNEKDMWREGQIQTEHFTARQLTILRAYEWERINFRTGAKRDAIARLSGICQEELTLQRQQTLRSI